jgi:hypothetical protein
VGTVRLRGNAGEQLAQHQVVVLLAVYSLEFVGRFELTGWKLAAALTPVTYIMWSLWLVAVGVFLLL